MKSVVEKQADIIDQIFANIDYLNDAMCTPLVELTNRLIRQDEQEVEQISDEYYQQSAENVVGIVKELDELIDNLPQLEKETPDFEEKLQKLIERNNQVNQKLYEVIGESKQCLDNLYEIDDDIKTHIMNSKK